ncbi:protein DVR-1 homolog [Hydra vulgaris]|uniref:Protein DVR-1 homolog n=1 Tax=Hydra vulgaris TaxID=6087 RepID=A0ABM4CSN9_HYDVU
MASINYKANICKLFAFNFIGFLLGHTIANEKNEKSKSITNNLGIYDENIPQYLRELYKRLSVFKTSEHLLHNGNVVRCYYNLKAESENGDHNYLFDVSDIISFNESLKRAELRLFKNASRKLLRSVLQVNIVNLFSNKTVSANIISSNSYGWQIYPLTEVVQNWIYNKNQNKGLTISIQKLYGTNTFVNFNSEKHKPFLVTFTKEKRELSLTSLLKKNIKIWEPREKSAIIVSQTTIVAKRRRRREINYNYKNICGVQQLIVPLKKVGWNNLFLFPDHFIINQCKGQCYIKKTAHSILQTLYADVLKNHEVKHPCCAPSKLSPGTALIYDRSSGKNVFKLVRLQNLTVTECECL